MKDRVTTSFNNLVKYILKSPLPHSKYNLLIQGLPGTGKTTFGIFLLYNLYLESNKNIGIITLLETEEQVVNLLNKFNWDFADRLTVMAPLPDRRDSITEEILKDLSFEFINEKNINILMIDGISILKYHYSGGELRKKT